MADIRVKNRASLAAKIASFLPFFGKKLLEGEEKILLKIDEIMHFLSIKKSQNVIVICVSKAPTSA